MPKIDIASIPQTNCSGYPAPHNAAVQGRWYRRLGLGSGLTQITAGHVVLAPGAWSSQRHWHDDEDKLLAMIAGEAVLVEDDSRVPVRAGDICIWPKGVVNGHHLINETDLPCVFIAIGSAADGPCRYSDIDMKWEAEGGYTHKDGTPYSEEPTT